jgi:transcriptional regulator with XRE-family HTH domain
MENGVGPYLRALRRRRQMSAELIAQRAGIRRATLSDWETGRRQPRLPELEAVLNALGASPVQRRQALARMQAPRAIWRLRQEAAQQASGFVESAGHAPNGGDLLRAMRLRRGWTLEEAGRAIGVAGNLISRWERNAMWPEGERLHALCYALNARQEELSALLCARLEREADGVCTPEALRQKAETFLSVPPTSAERIALFDLECLSLIAQVWPLAERDPFFRVLLGRIYVCYADFLFGQARFSACEKMTLRAQNLLDGSAPQLFPVSLALLRAAGAALETGGQRGIKRATEYLRCGLALPLDSDHETVLSAADRRVWMFCALGKAFYRQGRCEEALRVGQEALSLIAGIAEHNYVQDSLHRLLGFFVDTERYREAQEVAARIDRSLETYPMNVLHMARLTHAAGDRSAWAWSARARALCQDEQLLLIQPQYAGFFRYKADSLIQQFPELFP